MLQAYEGYWEKGQFFPIGQPVSIQGRRKVILTVLEDMREPNAQTEKDVGLASMSSTGFWDNPDDEVWDHV